MIQKDQFAKFSTYQTSFTCQGYEAI